jgi:hypothetical protein
MPDLVIRVVALLGGFVAGLVAWSAVALLMREQALARSGIRHLGAVRTALLGLLAVVVVTWLASPVRGSPWVWPGVLVGLAVSAVLFQLARSGRLAVRQLR